MAAPRMTMVITTINVPRLLEGYAGTLNGSAIFRM